MPSKRATSGALSGVRVVEVGESIPASFCAKLLADLGADVVKVEGPAGSPDRHAGPFPGGRPPGGEAPPETSGRHLYLNTNKTSVVADLATPAGRDIVASLVAEADALVEDRPDLAAQLGKTPPGLVWASITPYGLTGPYAGFVAEHLTLFHAGGEGQLLPSGPGWTLFPDRPPIQVGSEMGYYDAGNCAAVAVLGALYGQRRTGRGERIDISAHDCQVAMNRLRMVRFTHDGFVPRRRAAPYRVGGMFECSDGQIQMLPTGGTKWDAFFETPGGDRFAELGGAQNAATGADGRTNELLVEWCAARTKADAVATLGDLGFAVGPFAVPSDLLSSPQLIHRGFFQTVEHPDAGEVQLAGPPYRLSATPVTLEAAPRLGSGTGFGERPAQPSPTDSGAVAPLAGIRVLDFTWALAGPQTTLLLSLLGAEVIKVETDKRTDVTRIGIGGFPYDSTDHAPDFNTLNYNKRSFRVDLSQERGLDLVRRLVPLCDVIADNFRPGVMDRFGLDAETLLAQYPSLVVASSSGNGGSGPESRYAGFASIFGAAGGTSQQTGYADGPPTLLEESSDYRSGTFGAVAVLAALLHRQRTGVGQAIDLSSREVMTALSPAAVLAHLLGAPEVTRLGNRHPTMAPHNVYPAADELAWVSIAVATDEQWQALCEVIRREDWVDAFPTAAARKTAEDEIDDAITAWTTTRPSREAFVELQAVGVPSAPSFTFEDLAGDAHLDARRMLVELKHPLLGVQRVLRAPWIMADTECPATRHGPLLGQDNDYVLGELLGLDANEREALADVLQ